MGVSLVRLHLDSGLSASCDSPRLRAFVRKLGSMDHNDPTFLDLLATFRVRPVQVIGLDQVRDMHRRRQS